MTAAVMATAKNRQTAVMYTISASTFPAKFEACSGYNGISDCTVLVCSLFRATLQRWTRNTRCRANIPTAENQYSGNDAENSENATETNNFEYGGAIASGLRI